MNSLILGFIGGAILIITSKLGLGLSVKFKSKGTPLVLATHVVQYFVMGSYALLVLVVANVNALHFGLTLGFCIALNVAYQIYFAYSTILE